MSFQLSGSGPDIYERTLVPLWFGRWAEALLAQVSLAPGERVLDVACGTGITTRLAKRAVGDDGHVTGLDNNAGMLAMARTLAAELDITWVERDAVDTGLPSDSIDAIISQHGYHYFPDQAAALAEFHRILVPGGRIAVSIWDGHSAYTKALCAALETHISPRIARKQRAQRQTPSARTLEDSLSAAGFHDVSVVRQELSINVPLAADFVPLHLASMPIAAAFHDLADQNRTVLIADVSRALRDYVVGDRMIYPDAVNVLTGLKRHSMTSQGDGTLPSQV